ncbi:MAG: TldD/PmbA family protein [Chloroflexi bacterium]|nr:TldD/PmbA family protein [Chloroflexota bacterium]
MNDLLSCALDLASLKGAHYADARLIQTAEQSIGVKNGVVDTLNYTESAGFGVRVLVAGAWGFASSRDLTRGAVDRVTDLAVQIARASALAPGPAVVLGPPVTSRGRFVTPLQTDPFTVPTAEKLALLLNADREMHRVKGVTIGQGNLVFIREERLFANSEGAYTEQALYESGGGIVATAVDGDEVQHRSYPNSAGRQQGSAGWEYILAMDLPGHAGRVASEAAALLRADPCPVGVETTVILGGAQVALQVHESCGHPAELDRVFGAEAAYAGTSFLTPEKLGNFRYGSEIVNLTADAMRPTGLGTFGWDDEGVAAGAMPIVRDGIFVGYLTSRETAPRLGQVSNGCMRASGWNRIPLVRMPNVNLEPGPWKFDDLVADTDDGIYMETNRSWSIDDKRLNFQFGVEIGYEIKKGKLGRLLKNCTYTGVTPEFWSRCDAVCDESGWVLWGTPNCGKGQPHQVAHTSHGAAPARFRNIKVGVLI